MKKEFVIGVLGGMGTYATIHFFQQYAEVFKAKKEWDRPRIVIDNRCTMPSRVRAFILNENVDQLLNEMVESIQGLINLGCDRIVLACNTSHVFLPRIHQRIPDLQSKLINIVEACVNQVVESNIKTTFLLGSEGTIDSKIYQNMLEQNGINCICPVAEEYSMLRDCIEAVKQNKYSESVKRTFLNLINRYDTCILGCTELPILYEKYKNEVTCHNVFDPLYITLLHLKKEFAYD